MQVAWFHHCTWLSLSTADIAEISGKVFECFQWIAASATLLKVNANWLENDDDFLGSFV